MSTATATTTAEEPLGGCRGHGGCDKGDVRIPKMQGLPGPPQWHWCPVAAQWLDQQKLRSPVGAAEAVGAPDLAEGHLL